MIKKILHIHQKFLPYRGGSTQRLLNLIEGASVDYEHIILCENSENVENYSQVGRLRIFRYNKFWNIPFIIFKLRKENVDIIHYHNYRPAFWGLITKVVFPKAITLFELHSIYSPSTVIGRLLTNLVHFFSDEALVLSKLSVEALKNIGFKKKISIIYNGVDINKFKEPVNSSKDMEFINYNKPIIGYIGSIEPFQGVDIFCEIAKKVNEQRSDIQFVVIGGVESKHKELKLISGNYVDFFEFIGSALVPSVYKKFDLLLMSRPSLPETETAVPLKPIEALASGIPVVTTGVGGMVELQDILDSTNIKIFSDKDRIIQYLSELDFSSLAFEEEKNLDIFDVSMQSARLEKLYSGLIK